MKTFWGLLATIALLGWGLTQMGACYPQPPVCAPNDTSCRSCADPTNTNPTCPPFPSDAKKPKKTCYRMTLGCDDIQWDATPDSAGVLHGHCRKSDDTPVAIPCNDVPKPDGGSR